MVKIVVSIDNSKPNKKIKKLLIKINLFFSTIARTVVAIKVKRKTVIMTGESMEIFKE